MRGRANNLLALVLLVVFVFCADSSSYYLTMVIVISLDFTITPSKPGINLETHTLYLAGALNTYNIVNTIASVTDSPGFMLITLVESAAVFLALGEITGRRLSAGEMARAFPADGLGILVGGIFNAFPYTSYSQNVGLVMVTGVRSRYVCAAGGAILVFLGLLPKLGRLAAAIPQPVLGGAGLVMFGMVAANGIRILSTFALGRMTSSLLPFPSHPALSRRFPLRFSSIFLSGFPQSPIPA
jgi:xanthine/uracil permease